MQEFDKDPRRQQELRCRPYADRIYRQAFGEVKIHRDSDIVLDRDFAIDVRIKLPNGMNLLGQEKFLSKEYAKYNSVTVEYYQNQHTKELGDWFKIGVQIYFVGYENGNGFSPFILLDWTKVTIYSNQDKIKWHHNSNKNGSARASFAWVNMDDLNNCAILRG